MAEMWFYTCEGKQMDAVSIKDLRRLVGDGVLKPTDMVWKEGMPRWIRASSVTELFPDPASKLDQYFSNPKEEPRHDPPPPVVLSATKAGTSTPSVAEAEPRRRRRTAGNEVEGDADRKSRRPTDRKGNGSNSGVIIAFVVLAVVLLGALAGGVMILLFVSRSEDAKRDPEVKVEPEVKIDPAKFVKDGTAYDLQFSPRGRDSRTFFFRKGAEYEITVKTQPKAQNIDVDLMILNMNGERETLDDDPDSDCFVRWTPRRAGEYRLEVAYLDQQPGGPRVQSRVLIRELNRPEEKAIEPKDQPIDPPLPAGVLEKSGVAPSPKDLKPGESFPLKFRVKAGHQASIKVTVNKSRPGSDFNIIVTKENDPNTVIQADRGPEVNASVSFRIPATEIVSVQVQNASKTTTNRCTVIYNVGP